MSVNITEQFVKSVLVYVGESLHKELRSPASGQMDIESAIRIVLGEPSGYESHYMSPTLRRLVFGLQSARWTCDEVRTKCLLRIAIAHLRFRSTEIESEFVYIPSKVLLTRSLPRALRVAASLEHESGRSKLQAVKEFFFRSSRSPLESHKSGLLKAAKWYEGNSGYTAAIGLAGVVDPAKYVACASFGTDACGLAIRYRELMEWQMSLVDECRLVSDLFATTVDTVKETSVPSALSDYLLSEFADEVVAILTKANAPGIKHLVRTATLPN